MYKLLLRFVYYKCNYVLYTFYIASIRYYVLLEMKK